MVEKCSFCSHRVDQGSEPACVAACPTQVIHFGDLEDPDSSVSALSARPEAFRLGEETGADPSVWYLPAVSGARQRRSG